MSAVSSQMNSSSPARRCEYHIRVEADGDFAVGLLADASALSVTQVKAAMQKGAVWLEDGKGVRRLRRAKKPLRKHDSVHFYQDTAVLSATIPAPLCIADEGDYSVWHKPTGVLSQGSKWGDHCALPRWVEVNDTVGRPAFLVHRLDRAASGLMLIAHTKRTAQQLSSLFESRLLEKHYQAIVCGRFEAGTEVYEMPVDGKTARSHITRVQVSESGDSTLLSVQIETGRKHQIRKHLSGAGFPILGDRLYGGGGEVDLRLAAVCLRFQCPISGAAREYQLPENLRPQLR